MMTATLPAAGRTSSAAGIKHYYFSQDALAEQLMTAEMPADGVSVGPENERIVVQDGERDRAAPDENGNMLYLPTDPRFDQVQDFVAADRTLRFFEKHLGRRVAWGFGDHKLIVHPHAGEVLNAYYSRTEGSVNFCTHPDRKSNKVISTAQSSEVVSHECGHALLDSVRPDWLENLHDATGGFHEAIGDVLSFLVALDEPRNLDKLFLETGGDLRRPNSVARLAEEVGRALWDELGHEEPHHDYLRNSVNALVNADPATLPWEPPREDQLGRQVHNYSRVFSGACWDVLCSLYEQFKAEGEDPRVAVDRARDTLGALLIRGLEFTPVGVLPSYGHVVAAMLEADARDHEGRFEATLKNVFGKRNIHPPEPQAVPGEGLKLPAEGTTPTGAQLFLESHRQELGLPADLPLRFASSHGNDRGETFLIFHTEKEVPLLPGSLLPSFDDQNPVIRARGGLLLAFDAEGGLFYSQFNPITDERERELQDAARAALQNGAVATRAMFDGPPSPDQLFHEGHEPYQGFVAREGGRPVLRRSPIVT